jgi:hypothetical protein
MTRWGYGFRAVDGGTELTESWEFNPAGEPAFAERFGDDAEHQIEIRHQLAVNGIPETLAAIKHAAESA